MPASLTPQQCRAARELLAWSQARLADQVAMSRATICVFERGARNMARSNQLAVRLALEQAGVEFVEGAGGGADCADGSGVRLAQAAPRPGAA